MKRRIVINCINVDYTSGTIDDLKNDLEQIGFNIDVKNSIINDHISIIFNYDPSKLKISKSRNAGRKRKYVKDKPQKKLIEEIKNEIKVNGKIETSKKYGIHWTNLYKRIREAKKSNLNYIYL